MPTFNNLEGSLLPFPQNTQPARVNPAVNAGIDPGVADLSGLTDQVMNITADEQADLQRALAQQGGNIAEQQAGTKKAFEEFEANPTKKGFPKFISQITPLLLLGAFIADKTSGNANTRRNAAPKLKAYLDGKEAKKDKARATKKDNLQIALDRINIESGQATAKTNVAITGAESALNAKKAAVAGASGIQTANERKEAAALQFENQLTLLGEQHKNALERDEIKANATYETGGEMSLRYRKEATKAVLEKFATPIKNGEMDNAAIEKAIIDEIKIMMSLVTPRGARFDTSGALELGGGQFGNIGDEPTFGGVQPSPFERQQRQPYNFGDPRYSSPSPGKTARATEAEQAAFMLNAIEKALATDSSISANPQLQNLFNK